MQYVVLWELVNAYDWLIAFVVSLAQRSLYYHIAFMVSHIYGISM